MSTQEDAPCALKAVGLMGPHGHAYGWVRVFVKPGGVRDYRPASTAHWTPGELEIWRAWDTAHHLAEFPRGLALYPGGV